jgi:hypothetical protein
MTTYNPTVYVVTYYRFNHQERDKPIDSRFLNSKNHFVYYLIDSETPEPLVGKETLFEDRIDAQVKEASRYYFAEWGVFLNEERHSVLQYPFFMISSRFYEKNTTLRTTLDLEWDSMFSYFDSYQWGFLPSYEKPAVWVDAHTASIFMDMYITPKGNDLVKQLYGVDICDHASYRYIGDFFCHYIGFRDRAALLEFIDFARPLINLLFDEDLKPKCDISEYVRSTGAYRNEKPFTFMLEALSQLFFFVKRKRYFGMKYDGYFDVDPATRTALRIGSLASGAPVMDRVISRGESTVKIQVVQERKRALPDQTVPSNEARSSKETNGNEVLIAKLQAGLGDSCSILNIFPRSGALSLQAAQRGALIVTLDDSDYTKNSVTSDLWRELPEQTFSVDGEGFFSIRGEDQRELQFDAILFSAPPSSNLLEQARRHLAPTGIILMPRDETVKAYAEAHKLRKDELLTTIFELDFPLTIHDVVEITFDAYVSSGVARVTGDFLKEIPIEIYYRAAGALLESATSVGSVPLYTQSLRYARLVRTKEGELLQATALICLGHTEEGKQQLMSLKRRYAGDPQVDNVVQCFAPLFANVQPSNMVS